MKSAQVFCYQLFTPVIGTCLTEDLVAASLARDVVDNERWITAPYVDTDNPLVHSMMSPRMPAHAVLHFSPCVASSSLDFEEFLPQILFLLFKVSRDLLQSR